MTPAPSPLLTDPHFTVLGRTPCLVLHADGAVYVRATDRYVCNLSRPASVPKRSKYHDELHTLNQTWAKNLPWVKQTFPQLTLG